MEEKHERFNPLSFGENSEKYFESLMRFKENNEQYHLRKQFKPKRHKKVYETAKPLCWYIFLFYIFLGCLQLRATF